MRLGDAELVPVERAREISRHPLQRGLQSAAALFEGLGLRRRSLLTKDGLDLLVEITVAVGKVNQMSAQAALNAFDDLPRFDAETQASLVAALKKMLASLDETELPSLTGQIKTLLSSVASSE